MSNFVRNERVKMAANLFNNLAVITDVGDARIGFLALQREDGRGHAPPRHHQLATLGLVSDNRGGVVREDPVSGGRLPVRSRMARANSRIACWPFVTE